jgi:hypothetical protein
MPVMEPSFPGCEGIVEDLKLTVEEFAELL